MKRQPPITRPTSPSAAPPSPRRSLGEGGSAVRLPFSYPNLISAYSAYFAVPSSSSRAIHAPQSPLEISFSVHGCPWMSTDVHRNPAHSSPPNGANPRKISFQLHFVALCCTLLHSNPPIRQNSILGSRKSFPLFSSAQSNPFFPASHSPPVISTKTA